ncbi:hypothetical protein HG535_0D05810 [Zygotorulaspora mrakii]|uniref:BZIP domain-containing protein n=1 Tax=Zygotorulaspora mrakii TaxID=42260 RepID=A0A7H9B534_ZYGMR|nr:uncharacterized protein HG535_0D05810 [Zygotorulaspora mrakii]QLG72872.1 hypothetical protein HG535_0D05810 [Zygotorulaspora mrakii]
MGENVAKSGERSVSVDIPADFKVALPPRKRAKTQEEKEQRRIERILRNRKAAHHSREKKRLHLQVLEHKCHVMEQILGKIGNIEKLVGDDEAGIALLREYENMSDECSTPRSSYSPTNAVKQSEVGVGLDVDMNVNMNDVITPAQQQKEDGDFLTAGHSSSESSSSFSPNMALTPISFVKDEADAKNWDLLLTNENNTHAEVADPRSVSTNNETNNAMASREDNSLFPQLWLPFDGTEESSFELDDWRNPAVITATTCI